MDEEYEAIILRTVEFLLEEPLVERELLNWFARGRLAVLHRVEIAEGDAVGKDDVSEVLGELGLHRCRHSEGRGEPHRIRAVEHPSAIPTEQFRRLARREQPSNRFL